MALKQQKGDRRSLDQLKEHYEIEKELAITLRNASRQERRFLYSFLYEEMYRKIPHHPQLTKKLYPKKTIGMTSQTIFLKKFLSKDIIFLEVGPGDCACSFHVAQFVKKVYAVDISETITKSLTIPQNFQLLLSDGCSIDLPINSVNVAYSNQLMEHLHPDDALEQLQNIFNVLTHNGVYICITPNRLSGPHDISKYFDTVATGFHLREYTFTELSNLFKAVGFKKVRAYVGIKGKYVYFPVIPVILLEKLLSIFPYKVRKKIALNLPFRYLLDIILVGIK